MKKIIIYLVTLLLISAITNQIAAQCQLIIPHHSFTVCQGSPVQLEALLDCNIITDSNTFNNGTIGNGWTSSGAPMFNNPCLPSSDGSIYFWIGPSTSFPRFLTSPGIIVNDSCTICFDMVYASQANSTPCEGPDETTEGVHLQYSITSAAGPWFDFIYWDPVGGYDPILTSWQNYCLNFSINGMVWFRWYQTNTSGNDYDHWGLDNIYITGINNNNLPDSLFWSNASGVFYTGITPPVFYPDSNMQIYVSYTDSIGTQNDTVNITVIPTIFQVSFTGLPETTCNDSIFIPLSGTPFGGSYYGNGIQDSLFNPQIAGIGVHVITYNYAITDTSTIIGNVPIFFDDFSTDLGWTGYGSGGWARDVAVASIGCSGSQDPSTDHTPTSDNFIIGTYIGACYPNSMSQTYWLESPEIDCSGKTNCQLQFYSLSGVESPSFDHLYIDVSTNGGATWINIYSNTYSLVETIWTLRNYPIPQADNIANLKVRFGIGVTDGSVTYGGWNIDDLTVIGFGSVFISDTICSYTFTDTIIVDNCQTIKPVSGINDALNINIMPNPVTDETIFVEWLFPENTNAEYIEVFNMLGEKVAIKTISGKIGKTKLDVSTLPNSIYEVCIVSSNGKTAKCKLIKN